MKAPLEIIAHRINSLSMLRGLPPEYGAEIDIRSRKGRLILAHEPHAPGPGLEGFLDAWAAGRREAVLILNAKEDGLAAAALAMLRARRIERFFFLDLSFPSTVLLALRRGERRIALRVSEYEPLEAALRLKGKAEWAWLDCFTGRPPAAAVARRLARHFKVCLVSPELEGHSRRLVPRFRPLAPLVDAVCTKHPALWR